MHQSSGLTSLRDSIPQNQPEDTGSPETPDIRKAETKLNLLIEEIRIKTRARDDLIEEINILSRQRVANNLQTGSELSALTRRKVKLIAQIKDLFGLYNKIKSAKASVEKNYNKFSDERMTALELLGSSISRELAAQQITIDNKSKDLDSLALFLTEFFDYLEKFIEICEAETSLNALRGLSNRREQLSIDRERSVVKKLHTKANNALTKANERLDAAMVKYQEAHALSEFFEEEADKERKTLRKAGTLLRRRELKLAAGWRAIEAEKERLRVKEIFLNDRLEMARRNSKSKS